MFARFAGAAAAGLCLMPWVVQAQPAPTPGPVAPAADVGLGHAILKTLVETDSTHAHGSTLAAQEVAKLFLDAGFPAADVQIVIPPDHPTKGNVVVRLRGSGAGRPILWLCHLDVVEARREDWTYDPFRLTEADGWYYGRGTIDMKGADAAVIEAMLRLKRDGWRGDHDIIAAFTADEEAGGHDSGIAYLLAHDRPLIDAAYVINPDAGGGELKDGRRLDLGVQTSEKMFLTFQLEARDKGGHSSLPTPANPIYRMSRALARLAAFQFPIHRTATTRAYFAGLAQRESGQLAADLREAAHADALSPKAQARLSQRVDLNAQLRTTCTATMIDGGQGESALPERVKATIQCRVIPGETPAQIQQTLAQVLDDPQIAISVVTAAKVSPESPLDPALVKAVAEVTHSMWPGVELLPNMSAGASDSAYTRMAGIPSYGVDGGFGEVSDSRAHGRDERINIRAFDEDLEFTYRLMKRLAGPA